MRIIINFQLLIIKIFELNIITLRKFAKNVFNAKSFGLSAILTLFFTITISKLSAQSDRDYIKQGNYLYDNKKYNEAEISYRKSLEKNKNNIKGNYNLGASLYKQNQYSKSAEEFQNIISKNADPEVKAKAYHNLGTSLLGEKKYEDAVTAFKNSLRNNPNDIDTKYNYEYARRMLAVQQQQQKQQQQKQDQKQDKQQQKNDDKKDNKDQQQHQQDQKNDDKKDKKDKQQQQQPKVSKENAERILQALNQDEKNLQKKMQKRPKAAHVTIEKQW
ncbi:MAG: tetratricopeptide repeat protein [Candidatus Kapabacteria bacterium]|nr:tetratricopeptide repeat protein [Candidatus Kapabacteria bacterium]